MDLVEDLEALARVRFELLREDAHDAATRIRRGLWGGLLAGVLTIAGATFIALGLWKALVDLLGSSPPWVADLAAGGLILGGVTTAHLVRLATRRRRRLSRLKRDAGRDRSLS